MAQKLAAGTSHRHAHVGSSPYKHDLSEEAVICCTGTALSDIPGDMVHEVPDDSPLDHCPLCDPPEGEAWEACPQCQQPVRADATVCTSCGQNRPSSAT